MENNEEIKAAEPVAEKKPVRKAKEPEPSKYDMLSQPIPEEYHIPIQRDNVILTGYPGQIAIDRLNETYGIDGWFTHEEILKSEIIGGAWVVAMKVTLVLGKKEGDQTFKNGYGAMYAKRIEDAYGGAYTIALKRACRLLGIGRELYLRGEEDLVPPANSDAKKAASNDEIIAEYKVLLEKIDAAKTMEQLNSLEELIDKVNGDSVKKIVVNSYNNKKLNLTN